MPTEFQSILSKLFETDPASITNDVKPLTDIVLDHPAYSEEVFEALSVALSNVLQENTSAHPVCQAIITLAPYHRETALNLLEPIERMTAHQKATNRAQGYRLLGVLGTFESTDTPHVVEFVTNGLTDDSTAVQKAALWSLTKLGLADPAALSPAQTDLYHHLGTTSAPCVSNPEAGLIRKYATEALAAAATDTTVDEPSLDNSVFELNEPKRVAAWAIQTTAQEIGVQDANSDQLYGIKKVDESHQIASRLADQLQHQVRNDDSKLAVASTLALGYLCPRNWELRTGIQLLNTLIDNRQGRKVSAALLVMNNGAFKPTRSPRGGLVDTIEVVVESPSSHSVSGNAVAVPYDVNTSMELLSSNTHLSVLTGNNHATQVDVQMLHSHDQTIAADACCRDNMGVEPGETVKIGPTPPQPAAMATLAIPDDIELDSRLFQTRSVVYELTTQSFTEGDYLALDIAVDQETVKQLLSSSNCTPGRIEADLERHTLPIKVTSVTPQDATTIMPCTELTVQTEPQLHPEWANVEALRSSTFRCPMPLVTANLPGINSSSHVSKQATPHGRTIFHDLLQ